MYIYIHIRSSCLTDYNSPSFFTVLSERPGELGGRAEDFILRQKLFKASEYFNSAGSEYLIVTIGAWITVLHSIERRHVNKIFVEHWVPLISGEHCKRPAGCIQENDLFELGGTRKT